MPELPEVETVKNQIEALVSGEEIVAVHKSGFRLRKELGCTLSHLKGQKIGGLSRWGKRLLIHLVPSQDYLDVSLGMTGMLRVEKKGAKSVKHDHLIIKLTNGDKLIYNDPRRFGWVSCVDEEFNLNGWDPLLSSKKDFEKIIEQASRSQKNIYSFLMDQKYIVGLGNIYVQEILFLSKVSPLRISSNCKLDEMRLLRENTKRVIKLALSHGGSTILSYKNAAGEAGAFQTKLKVYGKKKAEPCVNCKKPLVHIQAARSITYCNNCQI
jgi:formamidopyrimidine-DNA glycosylase